jgi:[acyl-carrier-protein] S-malonyltransferase
VHNSPRQVVVSGESAALDRAAVEFRALGALRVLRLPVPFAGHSDALAPVADALGQLLDGCPVAPPTVPFYSTVTGERVADAATVRRLLLRSLVEPVRFHDAVRRALAQEACTSVVEIGSPAGARLLGCVRDTVAEEVRLGNVSTTHGEYLRYWLLDEQRCG